MRQQILRAVGCILLGISVGMIAGAAGLSALKTVLVAAIFLIALDFLAWSRV